MQQRRAAILEELKAYSKAAASLGRPFTDEERTKIETLKTENDTLKENIAKATTDEQTLSFIGTLESELSQPASRTTQPDALGGGTRIDPVGPQPFKSLGEQLQAIAYAGMHGDNPSARDQRLKWELLTAATGSAQAGVPSDGGYLIQKDFSTALMTRVNELSQLKSRIRIIPIGSDSDGLKLPCINETSRATGSRWGGIQMYWGAENDAATAKKPSFRTMELELKELIGLAYASNRLLRDASAIEAIFMQAFSEETVFMIEDSLINGSGAGQPLGFANGPGIVSVAKETNQPAATIVFENIQKMWARLWARSRANAVWIYNQDCEPQLNSMTIAVGTGGVPVYLPPGGLSQSPYATLMGRPMIPVEYCATLGTTGDIMLVDFSQIVGIEKDQMQADSSIHVRFTTNENTFRFIYRFDAQPVWNSQLTPFKGSATKSPYIKLDTRA